MNQTKPSNENSNSKSIERRKYHYFFEDNIHNAKDSITIEGLGTLHYKTIEIDKLDRFPGELEMFAFPIKYLFRINEIFNLYNLNGDLDYFYKQCREVISVPEMHQNEKGKEGNLNFQAYFHNVPDSLASISGDAIVVIALDATEGLLDEEGKRKYKLAGYIHANEFQFAPEVGSDVRHNGYYYNMLRISEELRDGKKIYRRSGVFSTIFTILLDLVNQNDVHFVYAAMGKENEKINSALKKLSEHFDKHWDILPITSNSKLTPLYGRKKYAKQLIDISDNKEKLQELFEKSQKHRGNYMFNQYPTFEDFYEAYERIMSYSKTSKAFMINDEQGNMKAATVALNWGDFFSFVLDNPKGIFKILANLEITDQLLFMWLTVGEPEYVDKMYRGICSYFRKNHKVKMSLMNSYAGDPYEKVKSSFINDPFNYFVIYDRPELYKQFQEKSKDKDGNIRIFIDPPLF